MREYAFPRSRRITRSKEIRGLLTQGRRARGEYVELFLLPGDAPSGCGGVVVPRFKHTIVERNRLKRRLREILRLYLLPAGAGVKLLLRARPAAYTVEFQDLRRDARAQWQRLTPTLTGAGEAR